MKFIKYVFLVLIISTSYGQLKSPEQVFGFKVGSDYKLADYSQMLEFYRQLADKSDRVILEEIGTSSERQPMLLLYISSSENLAQLDKWKKISSELARARIDEKTAKSHAKNGKAILWIDGGMHATERAHGQMTSELAYRVATEESSEMQKIRENVILLLMPVMNPDGMRLVVDWYKKNLGTPYETTGPPVLYQKYVGHDNNRDWFMNNMLETQAVSNKLYNEWYPQIIYNHHQTGPAWARIFMPPFSDPVNPNIHPGVTTGVNLVGTAMANRFAIKKMGGVVSDFQYSMWWNGGMRTAPYFHNQIGILTETSHSTPTPRFYDRDSIPKTIGSSRSKMVNTGTDIFLPLPWEAGESHFRDAVDYMLTASMGVMNIAADLREKWLFNIYVMGRDAIEDRVENDAFAYIIPNDQWDTYETGKLLSVLRMSGIEVNQSTKSFKANKKKYPKGTYVVYTAQAFRPHLVDMMEPQLYPELKDANGNPKVPYDLAGWTLPLQMGIKVDKINESFEVSTKSVDNLSVTMPKGIVSGSGKKGYTLSANSNASRIAINQLLAEGSDVYRQKNGSFYIKNKKKNELNDLAAKYSLNFQSSSSDLSSSSTKLTLPKVGLYKSWQANMDEGWTRWVLEQYGFPVDTLHNTDINERDLTQYSAIIFPSQSGNGILNGHMPNTMPKEYTGGIGLSGTLALKEYVENGGRLVALDAASDFFIQQFGLPMRNVVGKTPSSKFFIPGSLVSINVETGNELTFGMPKESVAYFVRSRAFEIIKLKDKGEGGKETLKKRPPDQPVTVLARYAKEKILLSGWAMGEKKNIGGKIAMAEVELGKGSIVLIGFRPQFRGQSRGTFKFLFNALY
jgi:hypothetical protein